MERITSRALLPKIIIDFLCVTVVGFAVLMFHLYGEPYHRGFFCNDESISHPFRESTVTNIMLYFGGLIFPVCVILIGEYYFIKNLNEQSSTKLFGCVNFPWVTLAYEKVGIFLFGAAVTIFTTDIAKYTIGRLRPHFFDLCKPNIDCSLPINQHVYIENFTCTAAGISKRLLKEVRLSFPSGHSSFSIYVMLYLALYLQLRMTWRGSKLLKHFLQLLFIITAWFTAMSRISNYKHHWSDVLCGMLIGITICLITFFGVGDFFKDKQRGRGCMMTKGTLNTTNNAETAMQVNNGTADHIR